ncbi:MAG TPA: helix-hairpin-helix domain-containing protein [Rhodospirillales bacterium]|jgi:DNA uptake protein ComE-like DNA-binding protein|nr:helix-hairpin-helix domain-containing protein [Rhodospirillales bacterium]
MINKAKAGVVGAVVVMASLMGGWPGAAGTQVAGAVTGAVVVASQAAAVDINSATEEQLRTLPGIGPARAQAIVAGRPFSGKDDLLKRGILPKNVYDGVKDRIVAKQK